MSDVQLVWLRFSLCVLGFWMIGTGSECVEPGWWRIVDVPPSAPVKHDQQSRSESLPTETLLRFSVMNRVLAVRDLLGGRCTAPRHCRRSAGAGLLGLAGLRRAVGTVGSRDRGSSRALCVATGSP